jgi:hypothetical protein
MNIFAALSPQKGKKSNLGPLIVNIVLKGAILA